MSLSLRRALFGIAFGILLALLLAPQTRWLVLRQIASGSIYSPRHTRQFVQSHPNDYPVQLAGKPDNAAQTQVEYARSLVPRFPNNPSLRAYILRYATTTLHLNRADANGALLSANSPPQTFRPSPPTPAAELAAYDADAATGERLDSDNAYFPFMRSIGLFAAHKDAEGLAAIQRAGTKQAWREYLADEVEGHWRILDSYDSHHEALSASAIQAAVLFPHFGQLRAVARLVMDKAIRAELAGHAEEGLTLRRSLAHLGDLMRSQGTTEITNLVGAAITAIAWIRPGGAPPLPPTSHTQETSHQRTQLQLEAYCSYVTLLGHPEAAQEAQAQAAAKEKTQQIISASLSKGGTFQQLERLALPLMASSLLAADIGSLALLGLAAWALSRLPRVQNRQPLPAGAAGGIWFTLLLSAVFTAMTMRIGPQELPLLQQILAALLLAPLAGGGLLAAVRPAFRGPFSNTLAAAVITLAALGGVFGLLLWQISRSYDINIVGLVVSSGGTDDPPTLLNPLQLQLMIAVLSAVALPLLLCMIFSIAARVKRVPVFAGMVNSFRFGTPLVLCLLMVGYGGLTLWLVRQESAANTALFQSLHGEGQYAAQLAGKTWPGAVP